MNIKISLLAGIFAILLFFGCFLFWGIDETPIQDFVLDNNVIPSNDSDRTKHKSFFVNKEALSGKNLIGFEETAVNEKNLHEQTEKLNLNQAEAGHDLSDAETIEYPDTIEGIKAQIYSKNIEYIEQIGLLDDLVQTGDADTKEFWNDEWASVDDWKKKTNGFKLEKNDNGDLVFSPDEQTARLYTFFENPQAYTYDEENKEFVNEVDFYGKTIYNVAKFINDDVLVMMTISGRKVDLNIYQKHAAQE